MAVQEILTVPNKILQNQTTEVIDVNTVQDLITDLLDTMYECGYGIGLAAPQIGRDESVVVIDISPEKDAPLILINPEIVSAEIKTKGEEGCLSVPGYFGDVERFQKVVVNALDRNGEPITIEDEEYLAIVMQHEIDHLKGKLFIDYLTPLTRKMALKKVKKFIKSS